MMIMSIYGNNIANLFLICKPSLKEKKDIYSYCYYSLYFNIL